MSELEQVLLTEMLQWYRLQRHDCLNHWQVIMGNLQLNKAEKALEYMRETVIAPKEEQKISLLVQPHLAGILLGFVLRLRSASVMASINYPEDMKKEEFWQDHWREEYGEALYGYTKECLEFVSNLAEGFANSGYVSAAGRINGLNADIYLYDEPNGFSCQFILEDDEKILLDKTVTLEVS